MQIHHSNCGNNELKPKVRGINDGNFVFVHVFTCDLIVVKLIPDIYFSKKVYLMIDVAQLN